MNIELTRLLAEARQAQSVVAHQATGMAEPHAYSRTRAAASGVLRLSEVLTVPSAAMARSYCHAIGGEVLKRQATKSTSDYLAEVSEALRVAERDGSPFVLPGSAVATMAGAIAGASLVAQAGATVLPISAAPDSPQPTLQTYGKALPAPVLYQRPEKFSNITAAKFSAMVDGADVDATAFPATRAQINWGDAASHAVRWELSRKDQKAKTDDELAWELEQALVRGIACLADSVLLAAIAAATPSAFTLAKAAAKGLTFAELRALVGTAGTGAAVGADGILRAAGIAAELTDTTAGSYIGAFTRAAVAVENEIQVVIDRTSLHGDLAVTCFASVQPLLPDAGAFWTAA